MLNLVHAGFFPVVPNLLVIDEVHVLGDGSQFYSPNMCKDEENTSAFPRKFSFHREYETGWICGALP